MHELERHNSITEDESEKGTHPGTSSECLPLFDVHCHCGLSMDGSPPAHPGDYELIATAKVCHWHQILAQLDAGRHRFGAVGLHPWYAEQWKSGCACDLEALLTRPEILALGEVGMDPSAGAGLDVQEQVLRAQIRIAVKVGKPLILHVNKGYHDILRILDDEGAQRIGGVVHGFSAGANIGMAFKRLGFYLGIGPLLLRNNVRKLPEALSHLSPDSLVLETDAQGGNPESASQKRRIAMLASIVRRLAEIYSVTEEEMRRRLWRNTCNLLALKPDTKCK